MGGSGSRKKKPTTPIPAYSPGVNRGGMSSLNSSPMSQPRDLAQCQQMIANLNNQLFAYQRTYGPPPGPYGYSPPMPMPPPPMGYGGYPYPGGSPGYGGYYGPGGTPPYGPPSPLFRPGGGYTPPGMAGPGGYRDTDFASIANIAGLSSPDIALLHDEYMRLTRGGTMKMDRATFRYILRDVLIEANNENIDRAIENVFLTVDRNHDGYIDFPEFVGAFKDVLKGHTFEHKINLSSNEIPNILTDQLRSSGVGTGIASKPITYVEQKPAMIANNTNGLSIVPLASRAIEQKALVYNNVVPLTVVDNAMPVIATSPSYVVAAPAQYLVTEPAALECSLY